MTQKLAGAWKLVSFVYHRPSGDLVYPLGKDAIGSLLYHADARFSMQISRHDRPVFTTDYFEHLDPEEIRIAVCGYFAYFGTYRVNQAKKVVTHLVDGSLFPNWVGSEQVRRFSLSGDRLILEKPPRAQGKEHRTGRQVWERVP